MSDIVFENDDIYERVKRDCEYLADFEILIRNKRRIYMRYMSFLSKKHRNSIDNINSVDDIDIVDDNNTVFDLNTKHDVVKLFDQYLNEFFCVNKKEILTEISTPSFENYEQIIIVLKQSYTFLRDIDELINNKRRAYLQI